MKKEIDQAARPIEIMVVDDAPENIRLSTRMLKEQGFAVSSSASGEVALSMINSKQPDLILLDIKMPGLDGYEVCRRLKANPETENLPIIFISALDSIDDKRKGFEAGGFDYISKPFEAKEVMLRVNNSLKTAFLQKELISKAKSAEDIIEGTHLGTLTWNIKTGEQSINERWAEILGYSVEDLSALSPDKYMKLIHSDDLEMAKLQNEKLFSKETERYDIDLRLRQKDGSYVWVNSRAKVSSWSSDGKPLMTTVSLIEISKRKNDEIEHCQIEELYDQLTDQIRSFNWEVDNEGLFTFVDYHSEAITGYKPEELILKKYFYELFPVNERAVYKSRTFGAFKSGLPFENLESKLSAKDGRIRTISTNGAPLLDNRGNILGYWGIGTDISLSLEPEESAVDQDEAVVEDQAAEHTGNWELDISSNVIWCAEESLNEFGFDFGADYLPLSIFQECICPEYQVMINEKLDKLVLNNEKFDSEFKLRKRNTGEEIFVHIVAVPQTDKNGHTTGAIGVIKDITEKKQKEANILYLKAHDLLTGLYSRRFFEVELSRLDTKRNLPITLVMVDVCKINHANESFGHERGDELLKQAADIIKRSCRADDIIARWGGNEFVVMLTQTDIAQADTLINRIKYLASQAKTPDLELAISSVSASKTSQGEDEED